MYYDYDYKSVMKNLYLKSILLDRPVEKGVKPGMQPRARDVIRALESKVVRIETLKSLILLQTTPSSKKWGPLVDCPGAKISVDGPALRDLLT